MDSCSGAVFNVPLCYVGPLYTIVLQAFQVDGNVWVSLCRGYLSIYAFRIGY